MKFIIASMLVSGWIYGTLIFEFYVFYLYFIAHCIINMYNTLKPILCELEHNFTLLNDYRSL